MGLPPRNLARWPGRLDPFVENYAESKLAVCYRRKLEPRGGPAADWKRFQSCTQPKEKPELQQALFQYLLESVFNSSTERITIRTSHCPFRQALESYTGVVANQSLYRRD
jgi:hypothetical protein